MSGISKVETIIEGFAGGMTKQLNETRLSNIQIEREKDELSKSL